MSVSARNLWLVYLAAAASLAVSVVLPSGPRYALWALALLAEAAVLLSGATRGGVAVDARHLAERFNLFMIIMLGEVVISVGAAATSVSSHKAGYWLGLLAGLVLAGALWWVYFDSAGEINALLLRPSDHAAVKAYALYALGYLLPTFALLLLAAGCGMALQQSPPSEATWFVTLGLAAYLVGIRGFQLGRRGRRWHLIQVAVVALTIGIALLNRVLAGPIVVAVAAVWAIVVAAAMSRRRAEPAPTG